MTLIEVMAGVGIMGALLAGVVMAQANATRQRAMATERLLAIDAAQGLLRNWWTDPASLPRNAQGKSADGRFSWRTREYPNESVNQLGGQAVRLEILSAGDVAPETMVSVDVVLPQKQPKQ